MAVREITVINVPSDIGSMIKGKHLTPAAFQSLEFVRKLTAAGFKVEERDALPDGPRSWSFGASCDPNGARNEEENVKVNRQVKEVVSGSIGGGGSNPPLQFIVGGECNIVPAIMSGLWENLAPKRVGLIYVDGDCDLTVPGEPGSSGNLASMTFTHMAMLPGALQSMQPFTRPDGKGVVDSSNSVIFGLNSALQSNTRSQMGFLMDEGYRVFTSAAVAKDPARRAKQALSYLEDKVDYIFVHLDVDAIDATAFPLANIPNRTGAGFEQVMTAMKIFLGSPKLCGLCVAEVNVDHDPGLKMTTMLIDELVNGLKGQQT
jgi:arginase family enzyme